MTEKESATSAGTQQMVQLTPRTENGVKYLCGGVGERETEAFKKAASDYDLMVSFATNNGAYVADVNVNISDPNGQTVLKTTCGPLMLVDLPKDGQYRVQAEKAGKTLVRTANVKEAGDVRRLYVTWSQQDISAGSASATGTNPTGSAGASEKESQAGTR